VDSRRSTEIILDDAVVLASGVAWLKIENTVFQADSVMTSLLNIPAPNSLPHWQPATWEDYVRSRDCLTEGSGRLFFNSGYLLIDMGGEGINHARFNRLLGLVLYIWFSQKSDQSYDDLGGCQLEKAGQQAAAPDAVIYIGNDFPQWQTGESRFVNLDRWRVPDLVAEVSDTTLAADLDEKKQLYAAVGVPEYWVVDVQGMRVLAFRLDGLGRYQEIVVSIALEGLPIELLSQTLAQLNQGTSNSTAAQWFSRQI
jgi:Uma2 family endonuclease